MSIAHARRNSPVETGLHPAVYGGLLGCLVWLAAAVWLAFGADRYTALQLAIATFLSVMFAVVPFWLSRMPRAEATPTTPQPLLRDWAEHDFITASGPVEGKHAAIMVLLAPASVALGLTATAAIAYLAAHGLL